MVNGTEAIDEYNRNIQGTNTAADQAKIVMGSYQECISRLTARFADLKIMLFESTQAYMPYVQAGFQVMVGFGQMLSGLNALNTCWQVCRNYITRTYNALGNFATALRNGTITTRLFSYWQGIASITTKVFTKTVSGLRNAFFWATGAVRIFSVAVANIPVLGWIAIAVGAITAAVIYLWDHCRKFRDCVRHWRSV